MSNCIIIHGCPSDVEKAMDPDTRTYDKHWIPWTKQELKVRGISTDTPLMPEPWDPVYEAYKEELNKYEINKDTVLIGHSCGCAFLVRWLGETKREVKKLILVAPWKIPDEGDRIKERFYVYEIDSDIKNRIQDIIMFTSNDEEEEGKESLKIFHGVLGGEIIDIPNQGHYTMNDMGRTDFPELIEAVLK
jgi:predicted alpha/beta hydrolase family esterase